MLGAIVGDIVGSVYEWHNIKTKDFPLQMLKSIIRPLPAGTQEIVLNHFYGSDKPE